MRSLMMARLLYALLVALVGFLVGRLALEAMQGGGASRSEETAPKRLPHRRWPSASDTKALGAAR